MDENNEDSIEQDDQQNIYQKFSLEQEQVSHCYLHPEEVAKMACPICHQPICESCQKTLSTNQFGQEKIICRRCWHNFLIKTVLFFAILVSSIYLGFIYFRL